MTLELLKLHWKASKWLMLPFLVAAFGLPLASSREAWGGTEGVELVRNGMFVLETAGMVGLLYPPIAALLGALLALTAWNWDHQKGHVYPLSLPVERWRYATTKFVGGLILLALPAVSMLAGGAISAGLVELPEGLQVYAGALSLQFYLASATAYAIVFALASGTIRTTVMVLSGFVILLTLGNGLFDLAGNFVPGLELVNVPNAMASILSEGPGPLRIFSGSWMLIDV